MAAQVVSFRCTLKNRLGTVLSSTLNRDVVTDSPVPDLKLKALAEGLKDLRKGERRSISLSAGEAYGFYYPERVLRRERDQLANGTQLKVGDRVGLRTPEGEVRLHRVIDATEELVVLDGNHPLAGQDLIFEIEAFEARAATAAELAELIDEQAAPSHHH